LVKYKKIKKLQNDEVCAILVKLVIGVVAALLKFAGFDWFHQAWASSKSGELMGFLLFLILVMYALWDTMRAKEGD
jgi:hypothetical protein